MGSIIRAKVSLGLLLAYGYFKVISVGNAQHLVEKIPWKNSSFWNAIFWKPAQYSLVKIWQLEWQDLQKHCDCKELSKLGMTASMKDVRNYLDFGKLQWIFYQDFSVYIMNKHTAAPPVKALVLVQQNRERPNADLARHELKARLLSCL